MIDLTTYEEVDDDKQNELLLEWLSDDTLHADLYRKVNESQRYQGVLPFPSRASARSYAYLVTNPSLIEDALTRPDEFSNRPYSALGSSTFVLGLDGPLHREQRTFIVELLRRCPEPQIDDALAKSWRDGSLLALKQDDFDLVDLVRRVAARFAGRLFGYGPGDQTRLAAVMKVLSDRLAFQIVGRHFQAPCVSGTAAPAPRGTGESPAARLFANTKGLIDGSSAHEEDEHDDEVPDDAGSGRPAGARKRFAPLLERIKSIAPAPQGVELHTIVIGCIAGLIGNVESAVAAAIQDFFDHNRLAEARDAARNDSAKLAAMIESALSRKPPAAFLPRVSELELSHPAVPAGASLILAMGAATTVAHAAPAAAACPHACSRANNAGGNALLYGGVGPDVGNDDLHRCPGESIARRAICYIVARVLCIDGLAQTQDPATSKTRRLEKQWGLRCLGYPLRHARASRLLQQPLSVVMRVRDPAVNGPKLRLLISSLAPLIERQLARSGFVHFAWFVLLDNDTKLALFTTYDGDFGAYVEHFALRVGRLFDRIFEYVEDPPMSPVRKHPKEFIDKIHQYNLTPVAGYFFSAYGDKTVSHINGALQSLSAQRRRALARSTASQTPIDQWNIQCLITTDYKLQCCRHFVLTVAPGQAAKARRCLADIASLVTTALARADLRSAINIGFTYRGLAALELDDSYLAVLRQKARAFAEGAHSRAARHLADTDASAAEQWEKLYRPNTAHALLTLHADDDQALDTLQTKITNLLAHTAWQGWDKHEKGEHLTHCRDKRTVHFGYTDGLSTVYINGIHSKPGGHAPGEMLLGHVNDAGFNAWAGLPDAAARFFANGTFGAFRKMEQNVAAFYQYVKQAAKDLDTSTEYVKAKLCGRWADGRLATEKDEPPPAAVGCAGVGVVADTADILANDPDGYGCPLGAHLRRMNPRSDPVVPTRTRPLIRRGMPYGKSYESTSDEDKDHTKRGLLGLFFCASLEDQFEHLLSSWGERNPIGPNNKGNSSDPLIGGHGSPGVFDIPMRDGTSRQLKGFAPFVTTRGTLYLFYPTTSALLTIAGAPASATHAPAGHEKQAATASPCAVGHMPDAPCGSGDS